MGWLTGLLGGLGLLPVTAEDPIPEMGTLQIALSEGQIEGIYGADWLKSIYLDGTPIKNPDNSLNFKGVALALVSGTNTQASVKGITGTESETGVNVQVVQATPVVRSITSNCNAVRVRIGIPALKKINSTSGNATGHAVTVKIERQNAAWNAGAWEIVTLEGAGVISGGPYGTKITKSFRIDLPITGTWQIRVTRVSVDDADVYHLSQTWWDAYTEIVDALLRYPNTSVLSIRLNSKQFRAIPKISADVLGVKVLVPSNYDPATRTYYTTGFGTSLGAWDGTFGDRATSTLNKKVWSDNPAWIFYDAATSVRYGAGSFLNASNMDKWSLYSIAQWCDTLVPDGKGGTEPRMACNLYIQTQEGAIKALGTLASIFWGVMYYAGGLIVPVADTDATPVALFTNANVKDGRFTYDGTARAARHTSALVSFTNPDLGWEQDVAVYEDAAGIARYGFNPTDIQGVACTSQGQALRLGKHAILSELMAYETVSFSPGLDGVVARPGDVVQIHDQFRAGASRFAGRCMAGSTVSLVVLDAPVTLASGTAYYLKTKTSAGAIETRTVTTTGTAQALAVSAPFTSAPIEGAVWMLQAGAVSALYRVVSIRESEGLQHDIVAILHDPSKYAALDLTSGDVVSRTPVVITSPAPSGLALTSVTRILQDRQAQTLTANWTIDGADSYSAYASRDYCPWVPMVVSGSTATLDNIQPGDWRVRICGNWSAGLSPAATASLTVTASITPPTWTSEALAGLSQIGNDGVLSKGEKPRVVMDYSTAAADYTLLEAKALATGTPYVPFATAFGDLQSYMAGLSPVYTDVTTDTVIDATVWRTKWADFYREKTSLSIKLSGAPPSTVDAIATTNWSLTTNASAPVIDSVTQVAGASVMLAGQTTKAENDIYRLDYTSPAGAVSVTYPNTGTYTKTYGGVGAHSNDANAWDGTSTVPNDSTFGSLAANSTSASTVQMVYSGWTGTGLTGTLHVKLTPQCNWVAQADGQNYTATVTVYYSTDSGTTWVLMASYDANQFNTMQDATASLTGATGSNIRVKVITSTTIPIVENLSPPPLTITGVAVPGASDINSVYLSIPTGTANWSFTRIADLIDGMLWRAKGGTVYGGKVYNVAVATDNTVTLTQQSYDPGSYDVPITWSGKPAASGKSMFPVVRPFTLHAQGHLGVAGTANTTNPKDFIVAKNGTTIGTVRFGATGAFSIVSFTATAFATGDILSVTAPAAQDATLADVGFVFRGNI